MIMSFIINLMPRNVQNVTTISLDATEWKLRDLEGVYSALETSDNAM